jgi:hypothetical protein
VSSSCPEGRARAFLEQLDNPLIRTRLAAELSASPPEPRALLFQSSAKAGPRSGILGPGQARVGPETARTPSRDLETTPGQRE